MSTKRFMVCHFNNGKFSYNKDVFKNLKKHTPNGSYLMMFVSMHEKTIREWQEYYFAQLGEWSKDTGYSKEELHNLIKGELFIELFGKNIGSTRDLDEIQWNILMYNLKDFLILKFENK